MPSITRTQWIIAAVFSMVLGIGGVIFLWLEFRQTRIPDPKTASVQTMAAFLTSKKINEMSRIDKYYFVKAFTDRHRTPQGIREICDALSQMSDDDVRQLQNHAIDVIGGGMAIHSRRFNAAATEREKNQIAKQVLDEMYPYEVFANAVVRGAPNVRRTVARSPTESFNLVMKRIPPPEIARMEPLFLKCAAYRLESRRKK